MHTGWHISILHVCILLNKMFINQNKKVHIYYHKSSLSVCVADYSYANSMQLYENKEMGWCKGNARNFKSISLCIHGTITPILVIIVLGLRWVRYVDTITPYQCTHTPDKYYNNFISVALYTLIQYIDTVFCYLTLSFSLTVPHFLTLPPFFALLC